jgi:hypothetical protein
MSKFNNRKTVIDGITFDSLAESNRYQELKMLEQAGEIWNLKAHPRFLLQEAFTYQGKTERAIYYEADFMYMEADACIVEDVKGGKATQTDLFKVKRKLFLKRHPDKFFRVVER